MKFFIMIGSGLVLCLALVSLSLRANSPKKNCAQAQYLTNEFYALVVRPKSHPNEITQLEETLSSLLRAKQIVCSGKSSMAATNFLNSMGSYIEEVRAHRSF
jgi:hypothetical protein